MPEITWVTSITGRYDAVAAAHFHSTEEMSTFIRTKLLVVGGIIDTETFICLHVPKHVHLVGTQ